MKGGVTITAVSHAEPRAAQGPDWALALALDCARLTAPPARRSLAGIDEVELGRGEARAFRRDGRKLRIDLPDGLASQAHVRLSRDGATWRVADCGSKNGTRVNGRRVEEAALSDGDTLECGATFLVLRRTLASVADLDEPAGCTALLRTLSPSFERELGILPRIARSRVPVLACSETGTGKEVLASAIHELSGRAGPFVPVNCGAIPEALLESELFGSRRGAFSGAEDRPGLVRGAGGGTLFLDEIAELSPSSQTALLRFLQDGEVVPLGSGKRVVVDARVIAATNQPLDELMARGRFRQDLHARLAGYQVQLPPLRARLEDLGLLIANLLQRLDPDGGERRLGRAAARALFAHRWPMNVRELEQVLRAALATAQGPELSAEDVRIATPVAGIEPPAASAEEPDERARILAALEACAGNQTRAALALGISRSSLVQKIRIFRIPRPRPR